VAARAAVTGLASDQSAEPGRSADDLAGPGRSADDLAGPARSVDYLTGLRARVVGAGAVGTVAAGVLAALGATVDRADDGPDLSWAGTWDVVICDRVASGADDEYLDLVARSLHADPPVAASCWVTASAFGLSGPARSYRGSELVTAAAGGLLAAVYDADRHVFPIPGQQALQSVGYEAALAALHGVSLSRTRGTPVHLDLSAQEAVAFCTNQQTPSHVLHKCGVGVGAGRYSAPSNPFPCKDGWCQIIVVDNHQFAAFCHAMGVPEWITIFPEVADRVAGAEMIDVVVAEWSSTWAKDELEEYLQARGVSATAVHTAAEVQESTVFRARHWVPSPPDALGPVVPVLITGVPGEHKPSPGPAVLAGLHVIESSNVLAGPLTGAILGAMGAQVVRVEPTERLDLYRQSGPFAGGIAGIERGAYFQGANHSKGSVTEGVAREHSAGALAWADAVIENTGRKRLEQHGIAPAAPGRGRNQVQLSISAFGRTGLDYTYRGYAPNVHAAAGFEDAIVGVAGRDVTIRTVMADYSSATWAASLVAAWWLGGHQGAYAFDLSMAEVMATRMIGTVPDEPGPDGVIVDLAGGGHLAVTGPDGTPWPAAVTAALGGAPGPDPATAADAGALLRSRAEDDLAGTVAILQAAGVPAYMVPGPEALPDDPQLAARGFFVRLDHPVIDGSFLMGVPWTEAGVPRGGWYRRAPLLGEQDEWARQAWAGDRDDAAAGEHGDDAAAGEPVGAPAARSD
jgi:crotonobetainyl-CoA:carnitine CoA-transferase CaiB-like acyl-CoA transferase